MLCLAASGLDSFAASVVVAHLRAMALRSGKQARYTAQRARHMLRHMLLTG